MEHQIFRMMRNLSKGETKVHKIKLCYTLKFCSCTTFKRKFVIKIYNNESGRKFCLEI